MPAPALRHYQLQLSNGVQTLVGAVPAGRALVISKIIVTSLSGTAITFGLQVGANNTNSWIAQNVPLNSGEVWTETGIVMLAGEVILLTGSAATGTVSVFGEEVDN